MKGMGGGRLRSTKLAIVLGAFWDVMIELAAEILSESRFSNVRAVHIGLGS